MLYAECLCRVMTSAMSDADYVCTLNEKSLKKAKDELNEDPMNRLGAVQNFRELVLQYPHIECPIGTMLQFGFVVPITVRCIMYMLIHILIS